MLQPEPYCSSKRAIRSKGLPGGKKGEKGGKIILLYTDVLKNIQTNN